MRVLLNNKRYHPLFKGTDLEGQTPFHLACKSKHEELITILVTMGKDVIDWNAKNHNGETGFHYACAQTTAELAVIPRLLDVEETKLDVNLCDNDGWTGFHWLCLYGCLTSINHLLALEEGRLDINSRTKRGWTGFDIACFKGHLTVINRLLEVANILNIDVARGLTEAQHWGHYEIVSSIQQYKAKKEIHQ